MSEPSAAEFSGVYVTRPTLTPCAHLDVEIAKLDSGAKCAKTSGTFSNRQRITAVVSLLRSAHVLGEGSKNY